MASVILHNMARLHNIPLPDEREEHGDLQGNEIQHINANQELLIENADSGLILRNRIIDYWF